MSQGEYGLKALEINNLFKKRGEIVVLDNINLTLEVGEFLGILGTAGAGKSTLLKILARIETPDRGNFKLLGVEPKGKAISVYRKIGIFLEEDSLISDLTVWQNLWFSLALLGIPYHTRRNLIAKYLNLARIWEFRKRTVGSLSRKERGLVHIVKILIASPPLLLLDEPERELDSWGMNFLLQQINRLREEENTAILWTSTKGEWFEKADRVAILKQGRIIACDTPGNLKRLIAKDNIVSSPIAPQALTLEKVFLSLIGGKNG